MSRGKRITAEKTERIVMMLPKMTNKEISAILDIGADSIQKIGNAWTDAESGNLGAVNRNKYGCGEAAIVYLRQKYCGVQDKEREDLYRKLEQTRQKLAQIDEMIVRLYESLGSL